MVEELAASDYICARYAFSNTHTHGKSTRSSLVSCLQQITYTHKTYLEDITEDMLVFEATPRNA